MNQRDRGRLKVLHEVEKGRLTQKQAGVQLKLIPQSGMGAGSSEASGEGGRRRDSAWAAGAGIEAAYCRGGTGEGGAVGEAGVSRLWADAGAGSAA